MLPPCFWSPVVAWRLNDCDLTCMLECTALLTPCPPMYHEYLSASKGYVHTLQQAHVKTCIVGRIITAIQLYTSPYNQGYKV